MKPVMTLEIPMSSIRSNLTRLLALALLALAAPLALAQAQARLERDGVVLYWGLVPAAVVSQKHALEEMHGVVPKDGGQNHHLVVALFWLDGRRIADAVVRAQLSETGIVDAPAKYLTPMVVDGQATYGQVFSVAKRGPYKFKVLVKLPGHPREVEFALSAWSPHGDER